MLVLSGCGDKEKSSPNNGNVNNNKSENKTENTSTPHKESSKIYTIGDTALVEHGEGNYEITLEKVTFQTIEYAGYSTKHAILDVTVKNLSDNTIDRDELAMMELWNQDIMHDGNLDMYENTARDSTKDSFNYFPEEGLKAKETIQAQAVIPIAKEGGDFELVVGNGIKGVPVTFFFSKDGKEMANGKPYEKDDSQPLKGYLDGKELTFNEQAVIKDMLGFTHKIKPLEIEMDETDHSTIATFEYSIDGEMELDQELLDSLIYNNFKLVQGDISIVDPILLTDISGYQKGEKITLQLKFEGDKAINNTLLFGSVSDGKNSSYWNFTPEDYK